MENTEQMTSLLKQVLSKLDETNRRLDQLEHQEAMQMREEQFFLRAIRDEIRNDNIM